jgi:YD repeat-containing protein
MTDIFASYDFEMLNEIDGHSIDPVSLIADQSTKQNTIVQTGKVVQTEKFVHTGTNGSGTPVFELIDKVVHVCDTLGHLTNSARVDPGTGAKRILYTADWRGPDGNDGDLKMLECDEQGVTLAYAYDGQAGTYPAQPDIVTNLIYDAAGHILTNTSSSGALTLASSAGFDLSGRITRATDEAGLTTTYTYASNGRITTNTLPGGATRIMERYVDGQPKSLTGSAAITEYYDYYLV